MADTGQKQRLEARLADLRQSRQSHADKADEQSVQVCLHDGAIQECETWLAALDTSVPTPVGSVLIAVCSLGQIRIEHETGVAAHSWPLMRTFKRHVVLGENVPDARNNAVKKAQELDFPYLMFWDDDVVPHDNMAVQHLLAVLDADPTIDVVGGIYPRKGTLEPIVVKDKDRYEGVWWGWRDGRAEQVYMTGTGFMVIRVSSLKKIPITDGRYFEVDGKRTDDFFFADWCMASGLKWYAAGNVVCDQIDLDGTVHRIEGAVPGIVRGEQTDGIPVEKLFPGAEVTVAGGEEGEQTEALIAAAPPDKARLTEEMSAAIVDNFHRLIYSGGVWTRTFWRGHQILKLPSDLFIYQELIHAVKPDYIVEAGTCHGGSAIFFADMLEMEGHGEVITVDVNFRPDRPDHHRIKYITADSIDAFTEIESVVHGKRVIVSLDSDHQKDHVLQEMELYAPIATEYLVVEDTNINHPVEVGGIGEGPMEAVVEFLRTHKEFEVDHSAHKFLVTFNPNGWLRRRFVADSAEPGHEDSHPPSTP